MRRLNNLKPQNCFKRHISENCVESIKTNDEPSCNPQTTIPKQHETLRYPQAKLRNCYLDNSYNVRTAIISLEEREAFQTTK
ncbi:hypothetical protein Dimus_029409 [Dionaea muscipula]